MELAETCDLWNWVDTEPVLYLHASLVVTHKSSALQLWAFSSSISCHGIWDEKNTFFSHELTLYLISSTFLWHFVDFFSKVCKMFQIQINFKIWSQVKLLRYFNSTILRMRIFPRWTHTAPFKWLHTVGELLVVQCLAQRRSTRSHIWLILQPVVVWLLILWLWFREWRGIGWG